jgi:hypothetical protein
LGISYLDSATPDFTAEVGIESGLIIQTPAEFIREIREIVQRGL